MRRPSPPGRPRRRPRRWDVLQDFKPDPQAQREVVRLVRAAIKEWGTTLRLVTIMAAAAACIIVMMWAR